MTAESSEPWTLVIDVAPLRETYYTGVPNVVREIARRGLFLADSELVIRFAVADREIHPDVVKQCVAENNGEALSNELLKPASGCAKVTGEAALFLHIKPPFRKYRIEAQFIHDLSFVTVPATHQPETVAAHMEQLSEQVETTDLFFTNSHATALDLNWYLGIPAENIVVTYLGSDVDQEFLQEFRNQLADWHKEPFVLLLGTVEPRKNYPFVLEWLGRNPSLLREFRFIFCGRDGWGPSFAALIDAAGLQEEYEQGRIKHIGFVSQRQKAALMATAEALLFPSIYEGFGLPVLEAMSCSLPVIATCSTAVPEILGPDGIYFDPCSIDSLTRAFEQFLSEHRAGSLPLRTESLKKRAGRFTYDAVFEKIIEKVKDQLVASAQLR